jgi:predicted unusual protein kinase regulating ubiquinone biosynthesis (AarF/ABC1/UbiB family)
MSVLGFIKNIALTLQLGYIFVAEWSRYFFIHNKYSTFIELLSLRLSRLNILYVKFFQAIASNTNLIDEETNEKLLQFTDNAPYEEDDIDYSLLYKLVSLHKIQIDFPQTSANAFRPMNSGMISLVYKGTLDNKTIVIKLKRKNIAQKLENAISHLLFILPFLPYFNVTDVIKRNIDIIRHQIDYTEEIRNMSLIRENCTHLKYIQIPKSFDHFTELYKDVIVMEYIDGVKFDSVQVEDKREFAKQVIKFGLVTCMIHGVTHGDLHSGNILFIKEYDESSSTEKRHCKYKLGIIDFGIIYKLENEFKGTMFDILTQLFDVTPRQSALKLLTSGIIEPADFLSHLTEDKRENIISYVETIIRENITCSKKANQIQIYAFLTKLREFLSTQELKSIGIQPSDRFVKSQLVLAMAHGVTLSLCDGNFVELMDEVLNETFHTNMLFG